MHKSDKEMLSRLAFPKKRVDVVIDSDTYNEIDDQFAIIYALKSSDRMDVKEVYAAPFYWPAFNFRSDSVADGMQRSYDEIHRMFDLLGVKMDNVYRGSESFLVDKETPVESEAVDHLISIAMNGSYSEENPLYVIALGAITNVASALIKEPKIANNIVIAWLGGHHIDYGDNKEFNFLQDIPSVQVVFESDAGLVLVPCKGVTSHLLSSKYELEASLDQSIPINKFLVDTFNGYKDDHLGYQKEIWDLGPVAYLVGEEYTNYSIIRRPYVCDNGNYVKDNNAPFMVYVDAVDRNKLFKDMFVKFNIK